MNAFETLLFQIFFGTALLIVGLEQLRALRRSTAPASARWFPNLSLYAFSSVVTRLLMPASIIGLAWGASPDSRLLMKAGLPPWAEAVAGFLLLDLTNYLLHRLSHRHPWLWRAHLVHHTDTLVDVTTTERHHPFEALFGGAMLAAVVAGFGLPIEAVGAFALSSAVIALWSHANIRLPARLERVLNWVIVTPGFHVIHHSSEQPETDSNFGTNLTVWDRLFGTLRPAQPLPPGRLGLEYLRRPEDSSLLGLLKQPFARLRVEADVPPVPVPSEGASGDPQPVVSPAWQSSLRAAAIGLLPALAVLVPTSVGLAAQWQVDAYRHGWLVLPALVYLLGWAWRDELLALAPSTSWLGVGVAFAGALAWAAASLVNVELGRQLAAVIALQGLALAALGWPVYRAVFPVLGLLFLAVPAGDVLQPALRWLALKGVEGFVTLAGWPLKSEGFWLSIGQHRYFVADECAGLAHVTLMGFLGYCFGLLMFRSLRRVLALAALGALLGVLSNQLRIAGIVLTDQLTGSQMELQSHGSAQWVALALVMATLLVVLARLQPESMPAPPSAGAAPRRPRSALGPAAAAGLVLLLAGASVALLDHRAGDAVPRLEASRVPAAVAGGWGLSAAQPPAMTPPRDGVASMAWTYQRADGSVAASVFQALTPKTRLSERLAAPTDSKQWRDIRHERITACDTAGCLELVHVVWRLDRKTPMQHVYAGFGVGDVQTTSQLKLRAASAWQRLRGDAAGVHMVALRTQGTEPSPADLAGLYRAALTSVTPR